MMKNKYEAMDYLDEAMKMLISPSSSANEKLVKLKASKEIQKGRYFYGNFLTRMKIIYTEEIPTAGVSITDSLNLYINPTFFCELNTLARLELLQHECEHLIHFHPARFAELPEGNAKVYNVAADATINERLDELKEFGVTVDKLNKSFGNIFNRDDSSESHYYKLMKEKEKLEKKIENGEIQLVDSHEKWGEGGQDPEFSKQILIDAMDKAVQATGAGNCPNHVIKELESLRKSVVNWKQVLRRFICRMLSYRGEKTRMKRNRRYGVLFQGKRKKPELVLTVLLDESGSVCDKQYAQFYAELEKIAPQVATLNIVNFDSQVNSEYVYKKGMKIRRTGQGGTLFKPAFEKAAELKSDAVICFTDGYPCDTIDKPKFPVLWASTSSDVRPFDFGMFLKVPVEE